jgi:mRNA interferase RelE/StbE
MAYAIEVAPAALRQLRKIDGTDRVRVIAAIDRLANQPRPAGVRALTGHPGLLRIRVGDYRVVYSVDDGKLVVTIIAAAHRRAIYRDL